ncbi:MAG: hypothetical protein HY914_09940 [Desulfomonile tiedjei]|nr:hypothetical protein [Desulfomonile tiedjei]
MRKVLALVLLVAAVVLTEFPAAVQAGPAGRAMGPPLDYTLMGFKNQGVWYFLCEAPVVVYRVPPHYLTYAPPPPCYGPVPAPLPAVPYRSK